MIVSLISKKFIYLNLISIQNIDIDYLYKFCNRREYLIHILVFCKKNDEYCMSLIHLHSTINIMCNDRLGSRVERFPFFKPPFFLKSNTLESIFNHIISLNWFYFLNNKDANHLFCRIYFCYSVPFIHKISLILRQKQG